MTSYPIITNRDVDNPLNYSVFVQYKERKIGVKLKTSADDCAETIQKHMYLIRQAICRYIFKEYGEIISEEFCLHR